MSAEALFCLPEVCQSESVANYDNVSSRLKKGYTFQPFSGNQSVSFVMSNGKKACIYGLIPETKKNGAGRIKYHSRIEDYLRMKSKSLATMTAHDGRKRLYRGSDGVGRDLQPATNNRTGEKTYLDVENGKWRYLSGPFLPDRPQPIQTSCVEIR